MSWDESSATDAEHDLGVMPVEDERAHTSAPADEGWLRLDKRKLLLDPITAVRSMIIPILALLFARPLFAVEQSG